MENNILDKLISSSPAPKIKDVAKEAGVSTATVSRALSRPDTVAEETRNIVLEAAQKIGYRVNIAARNLRSNRTGAVVVLVPNLGNPFFSRILAGLESTLAEERLSVLVVDTKQTAGDSPLFYEYLHHSRADGIISLDGSLSTELLRAEDPAHQIPIVFACEWHVNDTSPSVRVNNRRGAAAAAHHLADLGHTKIGYVGGPEGNVLSAARKEGFQRGLEELGLNFEEQWAFDGDFSIESGQMAGEKWLSLKERPSALFCANDEAALGIISRLHQSGVSVPKDVSIVGFDDIEVAKHFIPPLTTICQPRAQLGISAAKLLLKQLKEGIKDDLPTEVLEVQLVTRQSTAPYRGQ